MPRVRARTAHRLRHSGRFARTPEEEVAQGINWPDYRNKLSPFLLPLPDASAEAALAAIEEARRNEIIADTIEEGEPGTPPPFPSWEGLDR